MIEEIANWRDYLSDGSDDEKGSLFVGHVDNGRPLGEKEFIEKLEGIVGRALRRKKP